MFDDKYVDYHNASEHCHGLGARQVAQAHAERERERGPDGTFTLTSVTNLRKKIVTFIWYSYETFHYMFKAEFGTLVSLKVPSGEGETTDFFCCCF